MEAFVHAIFGLGNPGAEYANSRHNAGFLLAEQLAGRWSGVWGFEKKFVAEVARCHVGSRAVVLCRPHTYMNLSGQAVGAVARYYKATLPELLVVVDDADLPLGALRLRKEGSSGGHHGLESVESSLGTKGFARLRLGIGRRDPGSRQIVGYVLGSFTAEESGVMAKVLVRGCQQVECWLSDGIEQAMARYNGVVSP